MEKLTASNMLYDTFEDEYAATRASFEELKIDADRQMYLTTRHCNL